MVGGKLGLGVASHRRGQRQGADWEAAVKDQRPRRWQEDGRESSNKRASCQYQ